MKDWSEGDDNATAERAIDYPVAIGLACAAGVFGFGMFRFTKNLAAATREAQKASETYIKSNQENFEKFSKFTSSTAESLKNSAQNVKAEDFSKENILKNAEKLKTQAKSTDSQKIENLMKDAVRQIEKEFKKAQQQQSQNKGQNSKIGSIFEQVQKSFNSPEAKKMWEDMSKDIEKMTKSVKESQEKAKQSADKAKPDEAPSQPKAPAQKSALAKMLEEAFPDLFDKHLQGGFEDVTKQGMTNREARRILQFEVNGPPPSKQVIMDNFRLLSRVNHPDMGGSAFLSAKVNEAKEVLLKENKRRARR